jgi:hypothetical protein
MRFSLLNARGVPLFSPAGADGPFSVDDGDFTDDSELNNDPENPDDDDDLGFGEIDDDQNQDDDDDDLDGLGDGISLDAANILGDLFAEKPAQGQQPPGNRGGGTQDEQTPEEVQTQLAEELNAGIEALTIPEDFLPEDFDANDPKKLRAAMLGLQQRTARAAVALAFKPMQVAMTRIVGQLRAEMQSVASNTSTANQRQQLLEQYVPAANNRKLRPVVDMIFNQAAKKYPNDVRMQIKVTRKSLTAMGIKSGSTTKGGTARGSNQVQRAQSTLDMYSGLNTRQSNRQPQRRGNSGDRVLKALEAIANSSRNRNQG